jgi:predicted transcriptional regulator
MLHDINVEKIDFETVHSPNACQAEVTVQGSVESFSRNDRVRIGPTPSTDLQISGTVEAVEPTTGTITLDVGRMTTATEQVTAD